MLFSYFWHIFHDYHMRSTSFLSSKINILKGEILFTHEVIFVMRIWRADHTCKYLDILYFPLTHSLKSMFNTDEWKWITNEDDRFFFLLNRASLFKKSTFWLRKIQSWGKSEAVALISQAMWMKMRKGIKFELGCTNLCRQEKRGWEK